MANLGSRSLLPALAELACDGEQVASASSHRKTPVIIANLAGRSRPTTERRQAGCSTLAAGLTMLIVGDACWAADMP
jgi:hypothetical protein